MIQDLPFRANHSQPEKDMAHDTIALPGSYLANLYGNRFFVNSAHHQGCDRPGRGIEYVQVANDGTIEGFMHTKLPVIGVQWHPERMCLAHKRADTVDGQLLIRYFLNL